MTHRRHLLLAACAALAAPAAYGARTLTISAAASLTQAMKALAPVFEAGRPGVTLRLNLAASGVLLQQIRQGAPVDVLASADEETMAQGVRERLVDEATRVDFASNAVVLVVPANDAPAVAGVADLARPNVRRIAVGKPGTVPVGRYTRQALDATGLWSVLAPRFVFADSVRQVLDYVARGEVDAGFVYRTDAAVLPGRVRVVATLDRHAPVRYPAAVVADSREPALAREFVDFLRSPAAREVLARHGFGTP